MAMNSRDESTDRGRRLAAGSSRRANRHRGFSAPAKSTNVRVEDSASWPPGAQRIGRHGWSPPLTDDELSAKLLNLNLAMSSPEASGSTPRRKP
jgi:hypothetical protein